MKEETATTEDRIGVWKDLMGDGLQWKIVRQDDESIQHPKHVEAHDAVVVDFVGRFATDDRNDTTNGPIFHQATDWTIVVGDKDVIPALEMGIRFMKEGDHALIYAHSKFAYGGSMQRIHGSYELPIDSKVVYQVHVKKVISEDGTGILASCAFQLELAKSRKAIGNDVYANEWSNVYGKHKALLLYQKAGDAMTNILGDPTQTKWHEEARSILIDCLNNTSAVHMRVSDYGKAKESATLVLVRDPNNIKALLRAARAAMLDPSCSFDEATAAIDAAEDVNANDADVKKLRIELQRRKRDYNKKTKDILSKMSQAMKVSKHDESGPESTPESTTIDTTQQKSNESGRSRDVNQATSNSKDAEFDKPAPKWFSYLPYIFQFVILIISYIWMAYFRRNTFVEAKEHEER
jgi:tetratricopeptide (TPR) repeat protein